MKKCKATAPGKVILSGEHAVIYTKKIITAAVDHHVQVTLTESSAQYLQFSLKDLNLSFQLDWQALLALYKNIKKRWQAFLDHDSLLGEVLQNPSQLIQYAVACVAIEAGKELENVIIECGSSVPIGAGMGSSAALIVAAMGATNHFLGNPLSSEALLTLAWQAERLQHGQTRGQDVKTVLRGAVNYFEQLGEEDERMTTYPNIHYPFYLINTGKPATTTGETVMQVAEKFSHKKELWEEFARLTETFAYCLEKNYEADLFGLIRLNQKLLEKIGVVPERVQGFIRQATKIKSAVKVSGAGAVSGDAAGILLAMTTDFPRLQKLCEQFNYSIEPMTLAYKGLVND